jgi:hypothetical protein
MGGGSGLIYTVDSTQTEKRRTSMKDESDIAIARLAVDLTIALMANKQQANLLKDAKLPHDPGPLVIFDAVYAHLRKTIKETQS